MLLTAKLLLAPALIASASIIARRWGPAAAGWAASMPVLGGPILLILGIENGARFEAAAAKGATAGLISLVAFTVVHARAAYRIPRWWPPLMCGWLAFGISTELLSLIRASAVEWFAATVAACWLAWAVVGRSEPIGNQRLPSAANVAIRMLAGASMVLILTGMAGALGPGVAGLLTPFPVLASVLAVSTGLDGGPEAVAAYAGALLSGLPTFAVFNLTLAVTSSSIGVVRSFACAVALTLPCHMLMIAATRRLARANSVSPT